MSKRKRARNISFMLTPDRIRDHSKTVTRRDGWAWLRPGDLLCPVDRVRGMKKGQRPQPLLPPGWLLEVVDVSREPLEWISADDVVREGFPDKSPEEFIAMYRKHGDKCQDRMVTRIEFRYVQVPSDEEPDPTAGRESAG